MWAHSSFTDPWNPYSDEFRHRCSPSIHKSAISASSSMDTIPMISSSPRLSVTMRSPRYPIHYFLSVILIILIFHALFLRWIITGIPCVPRGLRLLPFILCSGSLKGACNCRTCLSGVSTSPTSPLPSISASTTSALALRVFSLSFPPNSPLSSSTTRSPSRAIRNSGLVSS